MNMQHVIKVDNNIHQIESTTKNALLLSVGKRPATLHLKSGKLVQRDITNGRFISKLVNI